MLLSLQKQMISLLSLLLLTTTTILLLLTTTPVVLADDENVIDIVHDAVIDDTPNLPTFLPKECSDNLDNLLPCWLDNNDECSNCAISEDGSLEGFLEFFKPPDTIFDTKYDSFFSTATITSTSSLECSDIETPICPTINCCTSCEESILELYECWLLVQSEDDERVSIISDNDNDNGSNSTGSSSSSVLLLENCSFECNIDTNTTTNTTTARGTSTLPPPV